MERDDEFVLETCEVLLAAFNNDWNKVIEELNEEGWEDSYLLFKMIESGVFELDVEDEQLELDFQE